MEESSKDILYPSISVCFERFEGSFIGHTVNMSNIILSLAVLKRNGAGHLQKVIINSNETDMEENREDTCHE